MAPANASTGTRHPLRNRRDHGIRTRFVGTTLLACALAALVPATATGGPRRAHIPLPAELTGTQDGVPCRIVVPANWNGTLLLYAHGTRLRAVGGPVVPQVAPAPYDGPGLATSLEGGLLADGYALAGSE